MSTTYNGWANWETWNTALWLTNEEGVYRYWMGAASMALASGDDARMSLAVRMRDEVPTSGMVGDSISWHRVDWLEVANAFLED